MSNAEWIITILLPLSAFLFGWGGGGAKWARRFVLPVVLATGGFLLGIPIAKCLVALPLMIISFSLGYGENHALWKKSLTILVFAVCLLPLTSGGNALLCLIPAVFFGCGYYLSRKYNWVTWRLIELGMGGVLSATVVMLALTQ